MKKEITCRICSRPAHKYVVIRKTTNTYKFANCWRCVDHIEKAKFAYGEDNVELRDTENATQNDIAKRG